MDLDLHFDVVCPYAYLAFSALGELEARTGAAVRLRPILLGGVFRAIGATDDPNRAFSEARARYQALDLERWARLRGVPLVRPPGHPRRTVLAMRAIHAAPDARRAAKALYRAYWGEGRDVEDPGVVAAALASEGLDGAAIVARAEAPEVKDALRAATDEAVRAGVFGVPAFVLPGGALYWGQDRMDLVCAALGAPEPAVEPRRAAEGAEVELFFDYSSPFAYLGFERLAPVLERTGARLRLRPFLLGGLFRDIGQVDVPLFAQPAAKQRHTALDLERWAARGGVPYAFPARFPMNTVKALRVTLAAPEGARAPLARALFRAYWGGPGRDLADDATLAELASSVGLDGPALAARARDADLRDALRASTDEARARGAFGAPTFFVHRPGAAPEMFWGQDRLGLVEAALR